MKKHFWKIEYSITIIVVTALILLFLPTSLFVTSRVAIYISRWNETYHKAEYMFTAIEAQADSDMLRTIKSATDSSLREKYLLQIIKPYMRLKEHDRFLRRYHPRYMDGRRVKDGDKYYFENVYLADNGHIVGIKDLPDIDDSEPGFVMLFDMNGMLGPNMWGKDIYGVSIYPGKSIRAIGYGMSTEEMKKDCSEEGTGLSCSHYYRIGGEFNE